MTTETRGLDVAGLKIYKKQNPAKFIHKFGDIDLEGLPDGTTLEDINKIRFAQLKKLPKTPLLHELDAVDKNEEIVIEKKENVDGGKTLKTKKVK